MAPSQDGSDNIFFTNEGATSYQQGTNPPGRQYSLPTESPVPRQPSHTSQINFVLFDCEAGCSDSFEVMKTTPGENEDARCSVEIIDKQSCWDINGE